MVRGPKKHLKRLAAPPHWMLSKLGGTWAPKPSPGPHKSRECIPANLVLRNRLHYALTGREAGMVMHNRNVLVDGVVRTDATYPLGFQDVLSIPKTNENFRLLYDVKGRFLLHRIRPEEAAYKLGKVTRVALGHKGIPYCVTHDGRTFRFQDPKIRVNDTVRIDLKTKKITEFVHFDTGNMCMVTGGRNAGRIGVITHKEKHPGTHDLIHIRDSDGNTFATRINYVFVIGKSSQPWISIPKAKGVRISTIQDRAIRMRKN
ncbi:putative 40S ribosomal protein S4 [Blattamonas nauphoetae]|uniref:40S ribosomal protein S4 n=1 Tax=Blattamonas nauphoetae TaxID=2049346 RepID=A0ABQ9XFM3_9EUKA|nr:putative 40S ribosomal protein S4 [Blattamonas nauphoetae]KAK2955825.1 putative 40S ribosomal protein S4 [Blattamonas nauphoetae]